VVGDNLIISMPDEKNFKWKDKVSIVIGVLQLKRFQLEGVGETTLNQLVGEEFFLKYQGVGSLTLNGKVQRFTARVEGVGTVNAHELDAESADVRLEGIGSAKVRASDSLNVRVEGLGSVTYYGKPAHLTKSAEGFGSIRAAD
jgi:hypothetical protein